MTSLWRNVMWCICLSTICAPAMAHEVRPALLQVSEVASGEYSVRWKVPARGGARLKLDVVFPPHCETVADGRVERDVAAVVRHWRVRCDGDITGNSIIIDGLETTLVETIARIEWIDRSPQNVRLTGGVNRFEVAERSTFVNVAQTYLPFGITHIWSGLDHLLFLIVLMVLIGHVRQIIIAVTSFTAAHSVTLALATLGFLSVPSGLIEALIALSIVFVAVEALANKGDGGTIGTRQPWVIAFAFGLLHGLGFANALTETGLPPDAIVPALFFFNVGVEIGQLFFVMGALVVIYLLRSQRPDFERPATRAAVYCAGIAGTFWTIERTVYLFAPFAF